MKSGPFYRDFLYSLFDAADERLASKFENGFPVVLAWGFVALVPLTAAFFRLDPQVGGFSDWLVFWFFHLLAFTFCFGLLAPDPEVAFRNPERATVLFFALFILNTGAILVGLFRLSLPYAVTSLAHAGFYFLAATWSLTLEREAES